MCDILSVLVSGLLLAHQNCADVRHNGANEAVQVICLPVQLSETSLYTAAPIRAWML
jgi:hypothetical protein